MHESPIAGEEVGDVDVEWSTVQRGDSTTCLGHQQRSGCHVPWLERGGEESIKATGGHVGKIECGRTGPLRVLC